MKTHQGLLLQKIRSIFSNEDIYENIKKGVDLKYHANSQSYFEVDVYLKNIKIAFEFQDEYHYIPTWYSNLPLTKVQQKDEIKEIKIKAKGDTFIVVPCWWDGERESLLATIAHHRPDLIDILSLSLPLSSFGEPIPLNPPIHFFDVKEIPGVGSLMTASFPRDVLSFSLNQWWIGEKYDGIRFCWNPIQKCAYSRSTNEIDLPVCFTSSLPSIFLDGELWFGRRNFSYTYMLIHGSSAQWQYLRMIAFDMPDYDYQSQKFETRYELLVNNIISATQFLILAPRVLNKNNKATEKIIEEIINDGGEGIVMRKINSAYERGPNQSLYKLKTYANDKEGMVIAINQDKSVRLQLPNGTQITIPKENITIPLSIGSIITFSFEINSRSSSPVNPQVVRVREEMEWEDVIRNFVPDARFLNEASRVPGLSLQNKGGSKEKKMKEYLERFALERGLDPLLPQTWLSIPLRLISQTWGGAKIIRRFGGYYNAIRYLFPNIGFDSLNSPVTEKWQYVENRRKFFENYAKERNFDPENPDHWYANLNKKILNTKWVTSLITYHNNSVHRALVDLFPNIGLDKSKLVLSYHGNPSFSFSQSTQSQSFAPMPERWNLKKRRRFFIEYAKRNNFDPLVSQNWYNQSKKKIMTAKGAISVLNHHKGNLSKALKESFPNVSFPLAFSVNERTKKHRHFFEQYAKEHNFDPHSPEGWYSQSLRRMLAYPGLSQIVAYYNHNIPKALIHLFPNIGLNLAQFYSVQSIGNSNSNSKIALYDDPLERKRFFEEFALKNRFDSSNADAWYSQSPVNIMSTKDAHHVMQHHGKSVVTALCELFPNLDFEVAKFAPIKIANWGNVQGRRQVLLKFAESNGFDPLVPENWYSVHKHNILAYEGAEKMIQYHKRSITTALLDLLPNIGLQREKLFKQT